MKKVPLMIGGLLALALSPLLFSFGVQAADTTYASLTSASTDTPEGFIRVTSAAWN